MMAGCLGGVPMGRGTDDIGGEPMSGETDLAGRALLAGGFRPVSSCSSSASDMTFFFAGWASLTALTIAGS